MFSGYRGAKIRDFCNFSLYQTVYFPQPALTFQRWFNSNDATGISTLDATNEGLQIAVEGQFATISSQGSDIQQVTTFTTDRRKLQQVVANGSQATVRVAPGVVLIRVKCYGEQERTYRVLVP